MYTEAVHVRVCHKRYFVSDILNGSRMVLLLFFRVLDLAMRAPCVCVGGGGGGGGACVCARASKLSEVVETQF